MNINDEFIDMINELDYYPMPYVNKELLSNTIEISLIDILRNDNKKYNMYANFVVKYFMHEKITEEDYNEGLKNGTQQEEFYYETNLRGNTLYYFIKEFYFNSEISEKLFLNNQIKEFSIYNIDKLIKHINTMGPSGMMFHKIDNLKIQYTYGNKTRSGRYIPTLTII